MTIVNGTSGSISPMANTSCIPEDRQHSPSSYEANANGQMHASAPVHADLPLDTFSSGTPAPPPAASSALSMDPPRRTYPNDHHIFVGNIPWLATAQDLKEYFIVESGTVVHIDFPFDAIKKRARGYANIYFSNQDAANEAIAKYHNLEFRGRRLQVKKPQRPFFPRYGHAPLHHPMYYPGAGTFTPPPPPPPPGPAGHMAGHMDGAGAPLMMTPPTYLSSMPGGAPHGGASSASASSDPSHMHGTGPWNTLYPAPMSPYVSYMSLPHENLYSIYTPLPYATYPNMPPPPPLAPLKPSQHLPFIMPDMRAIRNSEKPPDTSMKSNVLWFGNIPLGARWQNVKDIIKATGVTPIRVDLNISRSNRAPHHSATVIFPSAEDAQIAAGKLNGILWQGSPLLVRSDRHEFRERNTLFLRNVPFDCTKEQLQAFFNDYGFAPLQLSLAEFSYGRKGFATVELASPEEAQKAVEVLNGKFLSDRQLKVSLFERRTYGFKVFIGNLPWKATWQDIKDLFRRYGFYPGRVEIMTHPHNHQSKGFGIVIVSSREEAQRAIMVLNGVSLFGRQIVVRFDKS